MGNSFSRYAPWENDQHAALNGHEMTAFPDALNCVQMFLFVFLSAVSLVSCFAVDFYKHEVNPSAAMNKRWRGERVRRRVRVEARNSD